MSDERLIADFVRPLRTPKLRSVASGWDWSEDVPKPSAETLAKLRALDAHAARARFTARFCYVQGGRTDD
jgi:hypothetical protein